MRGSCAQVTGYLSMLANLLDNTMHGMTVASSFLLGYKACIYFVLNSCSISTCALL